MTQATESCAGRNAKSYISERICFVAKRLLKHTTASVSTISQISGFDEPAHFIRFFKNTVGLSP
ncbi:helix-turn-helix domain-containing protein [Pantoea vagans]|uniref:helix-turn-helix domain-containing protein n=1 Tax=Pantoea vagans TaxID=470934 RepID=UPI003B983565